MPSIKYWNKFYKKTNHIKKETLFAKFCAKKLKNYSGTLYDVGCGNGRDVFYFNKRKINCIGIDISHEVIKKNINGKRLLFRNKFIKSDFSSFFKKKIKNKKFSIYSRFTLHTINYKDEKKFLQNLSKQKKLDFIFIETRTTKDELYGVGKKIGRHEFISSHYRRFIDTKEIKKKLKKKFIIKYFKEGKNFAKFKKENPWILRIIAKKK